MMKKSNTRREERIGRYPVSRILPVLSRAQGWVDAEWLRASLDIEARAANDLMEQLLITGLLEDHGGAPDRDVYPLSDVGAELLSRPTSTLNRAQAEAELLAIGRRAAAVNRDESQPVRIAHVVVVGDYADGSERIERLLVGVRFWERGMSSRRQQTIVEGAIERARAAGVERADEEAWQAYFREDLLCRLAEGADHAVLFEHTVDVEVMLRTARLVVFDAMPSMVADTLEVLESRLVHTCESLREDETVAEIEDHLAELQDLTRRVVDCRLDLVAQIEDAQNRAQEIEDEDWDDAG